MPRIAVELNDTYMAMSRALHMTVIRNIATITGIPADTPIRYIGNDLALTMPGSTLDERGHIDNRLPGDARITIELGEEYDENFASTTPILRPEYQTIFYDEKLGVWLQPTYQRIKASMNIKFTGPDYTTVSSWISNMKRRATQDFGLQVHEVDYHYHIPLPIMQTLFEIYRLRENNCGYGDTIGDWFRACFTPRMDIIANQAGKRTLFVIREKQTEIVGQYDFTSQPPKAESENQSGAWTGGFTYNYSFDRVETMVIRFPTVVHNQLLSEQYISRLKTFEPSDIYALASLSMSAIRKFSYKRRGSVAWDGTPGIPMPAFDDWLPPPSTTVAGSVNIFRALMQLDKNNLHGLLSLTALGNWELPDEVLDYLREDPLSLMTPYNGLFYLSLYDTDTLMDTRELIISPDLDITHLRALDERRVYRLCLNMVTELQHLTAAAIERLANHPVLMRYTLMLIDNTIANAVIDNNTFYYDGRTVGNVSSPVSSTTNTQGVSNPVTDRIAVATETAARQNLGSLYETSAIVGQIPRPTNASSVTPLDIATAMQPPAAIQIVNGRAVSTNAVSVLPVICEDNTLLVSDIQRAISYITNRTSPVKTFTSAQGWRLVANLIVHAQEG